MSNIAIQRQLQTTTSTFTGNLGTNPVSTIADVQYVPLTIAMTQTPRTIPSVPAVLAASKLVAPVAGQFDKVRVGDFISITTAVITPLATNAIANAYLVSGQFYMVIPAGTLPKSGDSLAGTGVGVGAVVTKVNTATRIVFVSIANTATGLQTDVVATPKIRVTAVRKSTATANANEIDFDSVVGTGGTGTLTVTGGAPDGVVTVFRLTPIDGTTSAIGSINVAAAALTGAECVGEPNGLSNLTYNTLTYSTLGSYTTNFDTFLINAGVDSPL